MGEISAHADWVAVGGVWSELVSAGASLIRRERTGSFAGSGRLGPLRHSSSLVVPSSWNRVLYRLDTSSLKTVL
jgi:hypothetical protein